MRALIWLLRAVLLLLLFGLAVKNSVSVELKLYLDTVWRAPLSLVVVVCFAAGTALGASAALVTRVRQRRQILALQKQLAQRAEAAGVPAR